MAANTSLDACTVENFNPSITVTGWVSSSSSRGTVEILWSCCVTIVLCCWVCTFPNVPSKSDKWYHRIVDKLNLACIGLIGPDYLFGLALGQFSSAWRSVKLFRQLRRPKNAPEWSLVHGFFADMGGILLNTAPDAPQFPINAEQLHYLVEHGHIEYPTITKAEIKAKNKTDALSRIITIWQVFWFSVAELQRIKEGLPMTTLELTALSFSLTMLLTSLVWYAKPTIAQPIEMTTKDQRSFEDIRSAARQTTHPSLPEAWHRTPLDFIVPVHRRRFGPDVLWSYYCQLSYFTHTPLVSREVKTRPWDRIPPYWAPFELEVLPFAAVVLLGFSASLMAAWNFDFPTEGEKIAWRVCSTYHAMHAICVGFGYLWVLLMQPRKEKENGVGEGKSPAPSVMTSTDNEHMQAESMRQEIPDENRPIKPSRSLSDIEDVEAAATSSAGKARGRLSVIVRTTLDWLRAWRNIDPYGDPDMELRLRTTLIPMIGTFFYLGCRLFFYIEDFVSIRQQPAGVYRAVNRFLPFMD